MAKTEEEKLVEKTEMIAEKVEETEKVKEDKTVETPKKEEQKNPSINIDKAKAIFEVMPHITTIWFDKKGEWRFYPTPDSKPIHKEKN